MISCIPANSNDVAIWHVVHTDGDQEDLDDVEVQAGIQALADSVLATETAAPAEQELPCLLGSADLKEDVFSAEMVEVLRVSLQSAQHLVELRTEIFRSLGNELLGRGVYIIDTASDGNCQFRSLKLVLSAVAENQPSTTQEVRDLIADYIR